MELGDAVEIVLPDGETEAGHIADLDDATVRIARDDVANAAYVVARRRLVPTAPKAWRLMF